MAKQFQNNEVAYYYDLHPTKEDLMGESVVHARLVHYLIEVLTWLFRQQRCAIYENHNFYQTDNLMESPLAPDIAVIKGADLQETRSVRVGKDVAAPQVVFEIGSAETWKKDLEEKPEKYGCMGVKEYFAYDPNVPPLSRSRATPRRLCGWQLDKNQGQMREIPVYPDGRLWSPHLESFLVPDQQYLRLYDTHGHLRLTRAEALAEKMRALGIDPDAL